MLHVLRAAFLLLVYVAASAGSASAAPDAPARPGPAVSRQPAAKADGVDVHPGAMTFRWYDGTPVYRTEPGRNNANYLSDLKEVGPRKFDTVELENRYLRVCVVPEAGGFVGRAIYKPTGADMFVVSDRADAGHMGWLTGLKASFPYRELGIWANQPAGRTVVHHADGGATVAMWMEFSRYDAPWNARMYGRYTNKLLSQHVTLRPNRSLFSVTYRMVNPAPYKQRRQLWNTACWPRHHTKDGVVHNGQPLPAEATAEWIFPAAHVSGHSGRDFRAYAPDEMPLSARAKQGASVFAWANEYGFAGLWYPDAGVNRLRLVDPLVAPGAKQYDAGGRPGPYYVELWGGTDSVFEEVENLIEPGESWEFTAHYVTVTGIGKVDFANEDAAVSVRLGGPATQVEVVTYAPVARLVVRLDGQPAGDGGPCGPEQPVRVSIPRRMERTALSVNADGKEILARSFPLAYSPNEKQYAVIRKALAGRLFPATPAAVAADQLDAGQLGAAVATLQEATRKDANDAEAWHLLGAALTELGQPAAAQDALRKALAAEPPYPPARYYLALHALLAGNGSEALNQLDALIRQRPRHWEARLLRAAVLAPKSKERLAAARDLVSEDPADPRAQYVLWHAALGAGELDAAAAAHRALESLLEEEGAGRRLAEFQAAAGGVYLVPNRRKPAAGWRQYR
ncbi:MAG: DUF5107 domain-containing protein [Thermoguttaceae bacterium]|jgi:cytochrome c-type biogenesis protein CcmH/NrfG